jgi:hypothetical protein
MGASAEDGEACAKEMARARELWTGLGRPLDGARCLLIRGRLILGPNPDGAREVLERAADEYERLGVSGLARHSRELVA